MVVESYTKGSVEKMKEQGRRFRLFMGLAGLAILLTYVLSNKKVSDTDINKGLNTVPNQEQTDTTHAKDTIKATQKLMETKTISLNAAKTACQILSQCEKDSTTAAEISKKKIITEEERVKTLQLVISIKGGFEQLKGIIPLDKQIADLQIIQKDLYKNIQLKQT